MLWLFIDNFECFFTFHMLLFIYWCRLSELFSVGIDPVLECGMFIAHKFLSPNTSLWGQNLTPLHCHWFEWPDYGHSFFWSIGSETVLSLVPVVKSRIKFSFLVVETVQSPERSLTEILVCWVWPHRSTDIPHKEYSKDNISKIMLRLLEILYRI